MMQRISYSGLQKAVVAAELLAILSGAGVLLFVPPKGTPPQRPVKQQVKRTIEGIKAEPIAMLSAKEREELQASLKIDINTANMQELMLIPNVGEKTAELIIATREANGPFKSFEEVDAIPGFGEASMRNIREYVKIEGADPHAPPPPSAEPEPAAPAPRSAQAPAVSGPVNINTATSEQLQTVKGIGPSMAQKIIDYRNANGPFKTVDDLDNVSGIGPATLDKLRPLVTVQ